jgi:hypothetical protein
MPNANPTRAQRERAAKQYQARKKAARRAFNQVTKQRAEALEAQIVAYKCARCPWLFVGPMKEGRREFRSHKCRAD